VKRLYFVRHCQAAGQAPDRPLTTEGEAQALALADFLAPLGIDRIVSSPYRRAVGSVAPLAARLGVSVETDDRLAERVLSTEPMMDWEERMRTSYVEVERALPGGETTNAALARGTAAIDELLNDPAMRTGGTVAVSHGNLLSLLLGHYGLHDGGLAGYEAWRALSNPDVFELAHEAGQRRIRRIWMP
jgi:2,3-bisphosphoglycerate-dependent phosphoglycerate mutase